MLRFCLFLLFSFASFSTMALDHIRLSPGESNQDKRHHYPHRILKLALDETIPSYGEYTIDYAKVSLSRNRAFNELRKGGIINIYDAPPKSEWEETLIPIRVPVRKGLLGYRLFFINKGNETVLRNVHDIASLKELSAGLGEQWSITATMQELGFNVVTGSKYEGLFQMLELSRFEYFPRGMNEIFREFETRKNNYQKLIIEQTKALYIPTPTYFFVSPSSPRIAERLHKGMEMIVANGKLDKEFQKEFSGYIEAANLKKRLILRASNPQLSPETPLDNPIYWFNPSD